MSIMLTGSVKERRHASTMNIDRLSTLDMLKVIHQDDALISAAITPCLTRLPAWWITLRRPSVTAAAW
jgi:N-acetylmuramic acid 6-phosphate etherase